MKLISCHVEGFGKIKNKDYNFNETLTTFFENNGAGKSTLASFIKAMFYGLESYKENTVEFLDRQRFYPFDEGLFGGNITFEFEDSIYKIERFFGAKSQTKDMLKVYKDGNEVDLGVELHKYFFGIDKTSFERTAFITSDEIEVKSTSSINQKLNGFVNGSDLSIDVDEALLILEKTAKLYKKSKKGKDEISEISSEINKTLENIANAKAVESALEGKYERLNALKSEIKEKSKRVAELQSANAVLADWEHYESIEATINNCKSAISEIEKKYKNGIPSEDEINKISNLQLKERELTLKSQSGFSGEDEVKLSRLKQAFSKGVPTKEVVNSIEEGIYKLSKIETEIQSTEEKSISNEDQKILNKFSQKSLSDYEYGELQTAQVGYKQTKTELDCAPEYLSQKSTKSNLACLLTLIVSIILGVVGGLNINKIFGIVLLIIGGVLLLTSAFLYLLNRTSKIVINPEKRKIEIKLKGYEDEIKSKLFPYGYSFSNGVLFEVATFNAEFNRFIELQKTLKNSLSHLDLLKNQKLEIELKLKAFFSAYGLNSDNYISNLSRLQSGIDEFTSLLERKKSVLEINSSSITELEKVKSFINDFTKKYDVKVEELNTVLQDLSVYKTQKSSLKLNEEKLISFKKEKNLTEKPVIEGEDLVKLNEDVSSLQKNYSALAHEIYEDEYIVEKLDGYYIDKEVLQSKLDETVKKHKLLIATIDFLKKAEQNLKDKYVAPVKKEFVKYAEILEKTLGEKITMTKDFELKFERNGKERSDKHLSSGIKSICAFCFRIALIKNMYKNKKPFLILDDPFVNLDEEHLQKISSVVNELSKDMQIIYFTCHQSRNI